MVYEDRVTKELDNNDFIHVLTETAEAIAACGEEVQKSSETILHSFHVPGTKGEAHKDMLFAKVDDMKRMSALYDSAAKRLKRAARDLEDGRFREKTLSEVLVYGLFLLDQLKSEEDDAHSVLGMLREDSA